MTLRESKWNKRRSSADCNHVTARRATIERLILFGLLFLAFVFTSCGSPASTSDWFKSETAELRVKTVPPNCTAVAEKEIRESARMVAHWQCDSSWESARYREWVVEQLGRRYQTIRSDSDALVVGKNLRGDFESIRIETKHDGEKLHIWVELQSYPD